MASPSPCFVAVDDPVTVARRLVLAAATNVVQQVEESRSLLEDDQKQVSVPCVPKRSVFALAPAAEFHTCFSWRKPKCAAEKLQSAGHPRHQATAVITQLHVHKQHESGPCGFYALHNALVLLEVLSEPSDVRARRDLKTLLSGPAFWSQYNTFRAALKKFGASVCPSGKGYPWGKKHLTDVLERPHLQALLYRSICPRVFRCRGKMSCDNESAPKDHTHMLVTSLSEFTVESLPHLEKVFSRFDQCRKFGGSYAHAFILGCVSHWNLVVLNQVNGCPLEVIAAESKEESVVDYDMDKVEEKARNYDKIKDNPFKIMLYISSRRMTKRNIELLRDAGAGVKHVRAIYLDRQVESLWRSFVGHVLGVDWVVAEHADPATILQLQQQVKEQLSGLESRGDLALDEKKAPDPAAPGDDASLLDPQLMAGWFRDYYPLPLLVKRDLRRIKKVGLRFLSQLSRQRLCAWVYLMRHYYKHAPASALTDAQRSSLGGVCRSFTTTLAPVVDP